MARDVQKEIGDIVRKHRVVVFMKGSRHMPQCGFSAAAIQVLTKYSNDFETVDVLKDNEIREGVKRFSNWPTIPQVYVDGKFVGGSDIVREMDQAGELEALLRKPT
jgi:monothiol glutaredoxin